jgi:beta-lactamase class A
MISISDNDAFSLMVSACSETGSQVAARPIIQKYIDNEGYTDTTLTSMLLPTKYKAPSSPGRNYTTVDDCGLLLEKIYKGKCVSPESSRKFLDLLFQQIHINKIPAALPPGTRCANKTGDTDEFQHDAAIVYSPGGDYIITVMSTNCGAAIINTQEISRIVYDYFN